ncbi:MAG: 2-oxoacid:acceptor oxidoreductase family protein [Thermofilaceae archaeon]
MLNYKITGQELYTSQPWGSGEEMIYEVRWHGRGGQGVVTASDLLARAAILEGKYVYHAPEFGPERRGAPVRAYTRISDEPLEQHFGIYNPDAVVVIDPSLLKLYDLILSGIKTAGLLVVNAKVIEAGLLERVKKLGLSLWGVDAYTIAMNVFGNPLYNTPMLGAFIRAAGLVKLESVLNTVKERFKSPTVFERNVEAIKKAYEGVSKIV